MACLKALVVACMLASNAHEARAQAACQSTTNRYTETFATKNIDPALSSPGYDKKCWQASHSTSVLAAWYSGQILFALVCRWSQAPHGGSGHR